MNRTAISFSIVAMSACTGLDGDRDLPGVDDVDPVGLVSTADDDELAAAALLCPDFDRTNRDVSFCNDPDCPCATAEGDCDTSSQCVAGSACIGNIGALVGFPSSDDLCWDVEQIVTLFSGYHFDGYVRWLPVGRWDAADLAPIPNDELQALRLKPGFVVRLWSESGCWGSTKLITKDTNQLGVLDENVSCIEINPGVTIYRNAGFGGSTQSFDRGAYGHAALGDLGNDQAGSLIAAPGVLARLCSESGGAGGAGWGTCQTFSGSVAGLGVLNDAVSNVEVSYGATVYTDRGFDGVSQTFGAGTWPAASLIVVGNDSVSSIIVAPGMQATLCSENGGWGTCKTFRGHYSFVGSDLDDRTSSITVSAITSK